jgi:hypothetical protein
MGRWVLATLMRPGQCTLADKVRVPSAHRALGVDGGTLDVVLTSARSGGQDHNGGRETEKVNEIRCARAGVRRGGVSRIGRHGRRSIS